MVQFSPAQPRSPVLGAGLSHTQLFPSSVAFPWTQLTDRGEAAERESVTRAHLRAGGRGVGAGVGQPGARKRNGAA